MKISEIFSRSRREAAGFSTEPNPFDPGRGRNDIKVVDTPDPWPVVPEGNIGGESNPHPQFPKHIKHTLETVHTPGQEVPNGVASPKECNCAELLLGSTAKNESKDAPGFHKKVINKWLGLMSEPDDPNHLSNVSKLSQLKRVRPTADLNDEFQNHMLSHLYGAGMNHRNLGIADEELGEQFKSSQSTMQSAQAAAVNAHHYGLDNCGVCEQYLNSFKNHVKNYKNDVEAIAKSSPFKVDDAGKTHDELFKHIYDDYASGSTERSKNNASVSAAHDVLKNWDSHQKSAHNYSFTSFYDPYTPVVRSENTSELDSLYRSKVQRLSPGWDIKKREDVPQTEGKDREEAEEKPPSHVFKMPSDLPGGPEKTVVELPSHTVEGYPESYTYGDDFNELQSGGYYTKDRVYTNIEHTYTKPETPSVVQPRRFVNPGPSGPVRTRSPKRTSMKEDDMSRPKFNSNGKEAHFDPSAIGHAANWLLNQGKETLHDMAHPFSDINSFNHHWNDAYNQGNLGKPGQPQYYNGAPLSQVGHAGLGYAGVAALVNMLKNRLKGEQKEKDWQEHGETGADIPSFTEEHAKEGSAMKEAMLRVQAIADTKAKVCDKCGKHCKNKEECKANIDTRRRNDAAENAWYTGDIS